MGAEASSTHDAGDSQWLDRWAGERAFVLAPGASLTQFDVNAIRDRGRVVVINLACTMAPWADVLFSVDRYFWEDEAPTGKEFPGERWTFGGCNYAGRPDPLQYWQSYTKEPHEAAPGRMNVVAASGGSAISLAWLFGASPIILLGYDMQRTSGQIHFHPDHPRNNPDDNRFERWRRDLAVYAKALNKAGARVINCSRITAFHGFERRALEDVLE